MHGTVVRTLGAGDCFGEISLVDRTPRSATVRTTSPVSTLAPSAWSFAPLPEAEPEVARALLLVMRERLRAAEARATPERAAG